MKEISYKGQKYQLRDMTMGDVFALQRKIKEVPSPYVKKLAEYQKAGLLDPMPDIVAEELAELREEDKKIDKKFLSEFYFQWVLSIEGMSFLIQLLVEDGDKLDADTLAGLTVNSENVETLILHLNDFANSGAYDTIKAEAEKRAGTKKKATKKKKPRPGKKKKNPRRG